MDDFEARVMSHVETGSACWEWKGTISNGYGRFYPRGGGYLYAHRVVYEILKGPIPEGLNIDHLCRNTRCVNPGHLEPVITRINTLRGLGPTARNAVKLSCPSGHPYTKENTYRLRNGGRACRTCQNRRRAEIRRRRALEARDE